MKRIEENVVIETVADCLRSNAQLAEEKQKQPRSLAIEIAKAFEALDEELRNVAMRPSRNIRPTSRAK